MINIGYIANNFSLFSILGNESTDVPTHLDTVSGVNDWLLGLVLFVCFLLLALAKRLDPYLLRITIKSFFSLGTPDNLQKMDTRFNSTSFVLLGFLSFLSLWICIMLFGLYNAPMDNEKLVFFNFHFSILEFSLITFIITLLFVGYLFLGLLLVSRVTGEKDLMHVFITQSWVNLISFGILFFILALLWLLNPSIDDLLFQVFIILFSAFIILRLIKILIAAIINGVSWYYLILYLCTLELLPIIGIYSYVI